MGLTKHLLVALISIGMLSAQNKQQKASDSAYIDHFDTKISVRINASTDIQKFNFKNGADGNVVLKPNEEIRTSIFLDYKFLGVSYGFSPKFISINDDDDKKGESEFFNLGFRFKLGHWLQKVYYEKVKGFYVENTRDFIPDLPENSPFIIFPDLEIKSYGGYTAYVFNPNFSIAAVDGYFKRQLKSAGSFVPKIEYSYSLIKNEIDNELDKTNEISVTPILNYYYTLVHKYWFAGINIGSGLNFTFDKDKSYVNEELQSTSHSNDTNFAFQGQLNLGYNSDTFYGGLNFNIDNISSIKSKNNETIDASRNYFQFYIGYRFNSPKLVEESYHWLENKLKKKKHVSNTPKQTLKN